MHYLANVELMDCVTQWQVVQVYKTIIYVHHQCAKIQKQPKNKIKIEGEKKEHVRFLNRTETLFSVLP